ncbi:hypothetical protein [Moraxella lacunata]
MLIYGQLSQFAPMLTFKQFICRMAGCVIHTLLPLVHFKVK